MLHRAFIHFCLIILFAFTQMCAATHEISHLTDKQQQHQQDKNQQQSQCEQCLVISHAADAPLAQSFVFVGSPIQQFYFAGLTTISASLAATAYSARAPPSTSQT
jgi:hypothetical protein